MGGQRNVWHLWHKKSCEPRVLRYNISDDALQSERAMRGPQLHRFPISVLYSCQFRPCLAHGSETVTATVRNIWVILLLNRSPPIHALDKRTQVNAPKRQELHVWGIILLAYRSHSRVRRCMHCNRLKALSCECQPTSECWPWAVRQAATNYGMQFEASHPTSNQCVMKHRAD